MGSWQIAYLEIGGTVQERMAVGLQVTAVGMTVCFIVLTLLFAIFVLVGRLGQRPQGGRGPGGPGIASDAELSVPEASQPSSRALLSEVTTTESTTEKPVPQPERPTGLAIVAAVAAALAAATEDVGLRPARPSSRPTLARTGSSWALAGRVQLMEGRTMPARHRA